jgi:hypothetical protein
MEVKIIEYTPQNEQQLFTLIQREGEEWEYWQGESWAKKKISMPPKAKVCCLLNSSGG